jgi:hypothetical protein
MSDVTMRGGPLSASVAHCAGHWRPRGLEQVRDNLERFTFLLRGRY